MRNIIFVFCIALGLASCTDNTDTTGSDQASLPIKIAAEYPVTTTTRATANGFADGDQTGLFIIDYEGDEAGKMALSGNRASNVVLTYDEGSGKWTAPMTLYWAADGTPADIIGYYPFVEQLSSVTAQPVTISRDQSTVATQTAKGGYEQSDLLWAKAEKVSPTSETVTLNYRHVMAGVDICLERGTGFTADEWAQMEKSVLVSGTRLSGSIDLTTGTVSATDDGTNVIKAVTYGNDWRAVVIPQTVEAGKALVTITVDGQTYHLTKSEAMTYLAGKMHRFTITVDRRSASGDMKFSLKEEAVVAWEVDALLHDGLTRAYVVVNVDKEGGLQQAIAQAGLDYEAISNLKVTGSINRTDLLFMGQQMTSLAVLNLQEAVIGGTEAESGVLTGFKEHRILHHIVFPAKGLKIIGDSAFYQTGLNGSLIIPEGVEEVRECAFEQCKFTGTLSLPSTLRKIYKGAFYGNHFTGELLLPENVDFDRQVVQGHAFNTPVFGECRFTGSLHLPSGLTTLPHLGFSTMTGDIIIPQGITELASPHQKQYEWGVFSGGGYDGTLTIPEGLVKIGSRTFANTKIHGEVKMPSTLKIMEDRTFEGTRISRILFNDALMTMDKACFKDCQYLMGTVTWPKSCKRIPENTFENCTLLSGLVIHKDVAVIGDEAFLRCTNLTSIVCESEEPPLVGNDAFLGVSKSNCIVEVPASALSRYKNADGWSDFLRIVANNDFDCQPQTVCALNNTHEETLTVYASGAWTVESKPDWCTLSQTSGTGKTMVTLTVNMLAAGQGNRTGDIVFTQTTEGYTTTCKVSQYDYLYAEDESVRLQQHTRGSGIDLVFVGDGYDAASIADGSYLDLVKYQTECFFAVEPFLSMRDYFDVHVTFPLSQEKGVNTMYTYVNNRFGTIHGESGIAKGGCTSSLLLTETDGVKAYVQEHVPLVGAMNNGVIILVPNSTAYSGNTVIDDDGTSIAICPPSENDYPRDTRGTIQHEAGGHAFGKLGDENISQNGFIPSKFKDEIMKMHNRGWYQNLSLSGKLGEVSWASFIFDPRYSDKVDVFEGGYGYTRGVYRPESNSCMNYGIPYYNTPSRLEIWKRIKQNAGESWTMDEFYAQDTFDWGTTTVTRATLCPLPATAYVTDSHVGTLTVNFSRLGKEVRSMRIQAKNKRIKR